MRNLILIAIIAIGGCTPHREPATGATGVAEIRATGGATITAIDGQAVASGKAINRGEQVVRTSSGARKISVYTHGSSGAGHWTVPLTAEAGHAYRIAPASATALSLRVTDETTGRVIHGPPPDIAAQKVAPIRPASR